jgi:hypothetical protein
MIIDIPEESARLGALRLDIEGLWSVQDFQTLLLGTIQDSYQRVSATMLLGDFAREEQKRNDQLYKNDRADQSDRSWWSLLYGEVYYGRYEANVRVQSLESALQAVRPFVASLDIQTLRLESPGWVQLIGHLNPLHTIADFISKWRAENTKRMKITAEATLEREKMNRKFALDVLRHMPESGRREAAVRLGEIAEYAINPSVSGLSRLASDGRVLDAKLIEPETRLPSSR